MKVKIEREVELNGDSFFCVKTSDDKMIKAFSFRTDNENQRHEEALQFAHKIESGELTAIKEIIYETPA